MSPHPNLTLANRQGGVGAWEGGEHGRGGAWEGGAWEGGNMGGGEHGGGGGGGGGGSMGGWGWGGSGRVGGAGVSGWGAGWGDLNSAISVFMIQLNYYTVSLAASIMQLCILIIICMKK